MKTLQVRIKTDLTTEPVTASEAKLFCKVTGSTEDTLFTILITSARQALEEYTQSSFGEKTIHATWLQMPEDNQFELPYGPIISVDHVYWIDDEGAEEEATLNSDYYVTGDQDAIVTVSKFWSTSIGSTRAVRIEYTAGYGHTNTETLPAAIKQAVLKQVATDYQLREDMSESSVTVLDNRSKALVAPYRKKLWF